AHGGRDDLVPGRAGGNRDRHPIANVLESHASAADEHDRAGPPVVADDQVAAASHQKHGFIRRIRSAHDIDKFVTRRRRDDPRSRTAEPKRRVVGQQGRHGSRRYPGAVPAERATSLAAGRPRAFGVPTRGTTNPNRLRRRDNWIVARLAARLRAAADPLVIDLGYGASAITAIELASRLVTVRSDVRVRGLEIDPE